MYYSMGGDKMASLPRTPRLTDLFSKLLSAFQGLSAWRRADLAPWA